MTSLFSPGPPFCPGGRLPTPTRAPFSYCIGRGGKSRRPQGEDSGTWAPAFRHFLEQDTCPLRLKVSEERAKAAMRARPRLWEDPMDDGGADPEDYDEEGPRIYAPRDEDAEVMGGDQSDFRDYGGSRDWATASSAVSADGPPLAPHPLRNGFPREWRKSARPGVAEDLRRRRAGAAGVSTLTTQTPGIDSKSPWPSRLSRVGY